MLLREQTSSFSHFQCLGRPLDPDDMLPAHAQINVWCHHRMLGGMQGDQQATPPSFDTFQPAPDCSVVAFWAASAFPPTAFRVRRVLADSVAETSVLAVACYTYLGILCGKVTLQLQLQ